MSPIVSFGLGDLKPQIPKIWGGRPLSRAPKPSRPKETIGKIGELSSRTLGENQGQTHFFKVCWGELGGKIWAETLRPSSSLWPGWPGSLLPMDFRNFGPFAVFTLHAFTFFTTFAIFTVVLFLPFYGSTLLGACSRLSTYRRHPHLNSVECGGPSLVKTLMATIQFSPFMGEWLSFQNPKPNNPVAFTAPKPRSACKTPNPKLFLWNCPPPHPALENKTPNFRSSPKTFIEIRVLGCRFEHWGVGLLRFGFPIRVWGKRPHKQVWDVGFSHPLGFGDRILHAIRVSPRV